VEGEGEEEGSEEEDTNAAEEVDVKSTPNSTLQSGEKSELSSNSEDGEE
jgi:hypothetical protein